MEILVILIFVGCMALVYFKSNLGKPKRTRNAWRDYGGRSHGRMDYPRSPASQARSTTPSPVQDTPASTDSSGKPDRLALLQRATVKARRPINPEAYKILLILEKVVAESAPRARVLAEVGLGAFLGTEKDGGDDDDRAYWTFANMRADFLVIDGRGNPALVVEYQGTGHHLSNTTPERDMLKREALRKASVKLVEIGSDEAEDVVRVRLMDHVRAACQPRSGRATIKPTVGDQKTGIGSQELPTGAEVVRYAE